MRKTIGLLGGTFDPIHNGHILSALELKQRLGFDELRLIPCHQPAHRPPALCSSEHRVAMIQQALLGESRLLLDDRETKRDCVSYSIDTLEELRAELGGHVSLSLIMGTDAFATLDRWHRWTQLLLHAHIIVITRPGWTLPRSGALVQLKQQHCLDDPAKLKLTPSGALLFESLHPYPVSATEIRSAVASCYDVDPEGGTLRSDQYLRSVLPPGVLEYIYQHKLYFNQSTQ